jgi:hypothetical protein
MATGDPQDMAARLKAVLPPWFGPATPVLDAVLTGMGAVFSAIYALIGFVKAQTRIATASGLFLDLAAADFFGPALARAPGESDAAFRAAIEASLLAPKATRGALTAALTRLGAPPPALFEPMRPADTGAYGLALGYGVAGGYGSLALPYQCFATLTFASHVGIAGVAGWGAGAGWGTGPIEYVDTATLTSPAGPAALTAAIAGTLPLCATCWVRILP